MVDRIPNGACLQLGIGGMPNAIGAMIAERPEDLGVHTEMYVDSFVDMAKAGRITGRCRTLTTAAGLCVRCRHPKMYDYLDNNPECMSVPVDYTNDVRVISSTDNLSPSTTPLTLTCMAR